jgi:hypothetical protein
VLGRHDQGGHDGRQRGRREPGVLLPAILPRGGARPRDEARRPHDHLVERVLGEERLEGLGVDAGPPVHVAGAAADRAGEQDRVGGLVKLDAGPVRDAVDPLVLRPVAVRLL